MRRGNHVSAMVYTSHGAISNTLMNIGKTPQGEVEHQLTVSSDDDEEIERLVKEAVHAIATDYSAAAHRHPARRMSDPCTLKLAVVASATGCRVILDAGLAESILTMPVQAVQLDVVLDTGIVSSAESESDDDRRVASSLQMWMYNNESTREVLSRHKHELQLVRAKISTIDRRVFVFIKLDAGASSGIGDHISQGIKAAEQLQRLVGHEQWDTVERLISCTVFVDSSNRSVDRIDWSAASSLLRSGYGIKIDWIAKGKSGRYMME